MAFSLGSLLATAGSARAGARRGQREERQYQDDLALQREQADRANRMAMFNEWAQRENIRLRERDQDMDSQDRRTAAELRNEQQAAQRKAQAEALIAARMEKGWTDSTPGEQRMDAARAVMRINPMTGMTRGADIDQRTYVEEGAKPFAKEIEGVKFEAGRAAGGPQRTLIGGRALRYDPQDVLNRTKDKEATDFEKDARLARIRGQEARITIQTPRPERDGGKPLPPATATRIATQSAESLSKIRDIEDAIAATTGVKDYSGPWDNFRDKNMEKWGQEIDPKRVAARAAYAKVVTPILTGEFGANLTKLERDYISPYITTLSDASEDRIPIVLGLIRKALSDARDEQLSALEATGSEDLANRLRNLPNNRGAAGGSPPPAPGGSRPPMASLRDKP